MIKAAVEASREVEACERREEHLEHIAAKGLRTTLKVEQAAAKLEAERAAKAQALNDRLEAAALRKTTVRYPPCARVKPTVADVAPMVAKRGLGGLVKSFVKGAFVAIAGGAVARLLKMLPFGNRK